MENVWILVASSDRARVLEAGSPREPLREGGVLTRDETPGRHLEGTNVVVPGVQGAELTQDDNSASNADPHIAAFAAQVGDYLERALKHREFGRLVLMAPEEMLNLLKVGFTPEVRERVGLEINVDLINADPTVIRASLPDSL